MENIFDFSGKTILITGASSGIGRQTAILLSEMGARTVLVARREEKLKETLSMLSGENHIYRLADLSRLDEIDPLVSDIVKSVGKLDGMAFCAGVASPRPCKLSDPKYVTEIMNNNFLSFYETARQFLKKNNSCDGAKLVVISSMASVLPDKGQSVYAASKAAIDAAVKSMAKEMTPRRININCVRPGWVDTPMVQACISPVGDQPLGIIMPESISQMIAYLLSPASDKITGSAFNVDGGVGL